MTLVDQVALRFEEERHRAQQKKIQQEQQKQLQKAQEAAKAAQRANDNSILW